MDSLARDLAELKVRPISDLGIDPDGKEALAFAVLAYETFHGRPSNMPSATGAKSHVILGKISPGPVR
jgi:anhydro-N-acetylmuramic acid kinase